MFDFEDEDKDNPIGSLLRYNREKRKLDLDRISEELRIRRDYLEAIEQGLFGVLPAGIYRRSFVKAYAEYLKLDSGHVLEMLDQYEKTPGKPAKEQSPARKLQEQETSDEEPPAEEKPAAPSYARPAKRTTGSRVVYWFSIALGLLIGVLCVIFLFRNRMEDIQPVFVAQAADVESLTTVPEPPDTMELFLNLLDRKIGTAPELTLRIEAAGRSWLKVFSDEAELFTGFLNENMSVEFKFKNKLSINIGVNAGIKAFLNGFELIPLVKGISLIDRGNFSTFIPTEKANEIVRRHE